MSRSITGRPRSSSRTAPPTIQASVPASTSRASSCIDDRPARAARVARDPGDELVVDRAGDTGMILREDAAAEEDDRSADRKLPVELDGEGVHRDGADDATGLPRDADGRPGQRALEAVRVADGHEPDPRLAFGDEAAPVAGALPGRQPLDLREVAFPAQDGLQPVAGRLLAEGREPVQRDPAARGVEPRGRV